MATTSTIGTASRNYSTIQAWHDAFATGGWIGECYNDSVFNISAQISLTGKSTSATDFITLRCAAGQSFYDNASAQTNALKYNQANGVALLGAGGVSVMLANEANTTITGLQIKSTGNYGPYAINFSSTSGVLENFIVDCVATGVFLGAGTVRNGLIVAAVGGSRAMVFSYAAASATFVNVTAVCPSNVTSTQSAIQVSGGSGGIVKNCAVFGYTAFSAGSYQSSSSNNASDQTISFGTSNQASKTYANQFVGTTTTAQDFRLKAGADCLDTGATDTTHIPAAIDIVRTARPQGTAWDIGAWELVATVSFTWFDMAQPTQPSRQPVDLIAY